MMSDSRLNRFKVGKWYKKSERNVSKGLTTTKVTAGSRRGFNFKSIGSEDFLMNLGKMTRKNRAQNTNAKGRDESIRKKMFLKMQRMRMDLSKKNLREKCKENRSNEKKKKRGVLIFDDEEDTGQSHQIDFLKFQGNKENHSAKKLEDNMRDLGIVAEAEGEEKVTSASRDLMKEIGDFKGEVLNGVNGNWEDIVFV